MSMMQNTGLPSEIADARLLGRRLLPRQPAAGTEKRPGRGIVG
jgi:hypothetical protein